MGGNNFAIYTNDKYTVNVGYYKAVKETRILIEPKGALPTLAEDNNTKKVTTSQITMFGVYTAATKGGLGLVIRLEDGRFIVVDGGGHSNEHVKNFVTILKNQSKDYTDTPTVAAWVITHTHSDHTYLLIYGYESIKNAGVKVESFMLNEMSRFEDNRSISRNDELEKHGIYSFPDYDHGPEHEKIIETVAPAFEAELYKPHIGQVFYISNCKIEVLYTLEGYAPVICNGQNTASVVMKMTFTDSATGKETVFLNTGDATGHSMRTANTFFGDYLKSDVLAVAHHGCDTSWGDDEGMVAANKKVNAKCLLWPNEYKLDLNAYPYTSTINRAIFQNSDYKESYSHGVLGEGIVVPLPYEVGNVKTGKLY